MSRRCAYLTMDEPDGFEVDIESAFPHLETRGWRFQPVPWRSATVSWEEFDAVYIGAPWDYPEEPDRFLDVLGRIVDAGVVLVNDIDLVRWTVAKTYLRDLEQRGAAIVPSLWFESFDPACLDTAFERFDSEQIIIKPVVSTNATHTYLLDRDRAAEMKDDLATIFDERPFVIQAFVASVQHEGEYSLFFFDRQYSHSVRKVPADADFRVQEQFGADVADAEPGPDVLAAAKGVIALVDPPPVYARVDMVRGAGGEPLLMELELIEPSMYLRKSPHAAARFAGALERYVNEKTGGTAS